MKALHINSSAPFFSKNPGKEISIEDFNILFTILSALTWKKYNGPIKLYTDTPILEYYKKIGIEDLWDEIDTETLDNFPNEINPGIFWAAAKILAIRKESAPVLMVDQDMIVWKNIDNIIQNEELVVFHREGLHMIDIYPPFDWLKKRADYLPDSNWDWNIMPCNTSFAYIRNNDFLKYYTDAAIDFMWKNFEYPQDNNSQMVFAEQRIISMCAAAKGINIKSCLEDPFQNDNDTFTHLWNGKNMARADEQIRRKICCSLVRHIKTSFPTFEIRTDFLKNIFEQYS